MDLGAPTSYMAVPRGIPVLAASGSEIGRVKTVLHVREKNIFDGIVITTTDGERFVDAPEVDRLYERGVLTTLSDDEASELPRPHAGPLRRWLARR